MRRTLAALAAGACLAGCGSTVQVSGTGATLLPGDGLGGPATPGEGVPALPTGENAVAPGLGSTVDPARSGGATGPRATGSPPLATRTPVGSAAPTLSALAPVKVGVLYADGIDKVAASFGVSGLTTGDTSKQVQAVMSWVRANGGLGGHPVEVYPVAIDLGRAASDPDGANQAACAKLTQDHKVRFVVTILNLRPVDLPCYAKGGAAVLDDITGVSKSTMDKYADFLAAPGEFGMARIVGNLVDDLWARGWLTPRSKVGAFSVDVPASEEVVKGYLAPALARHGLKVDSDQRVANDASSINQATSVAVRFRADGVDRVLPINASPLFLMNAAENQGYHPLYAMHSSFGPGALLESAAPKRQLVGSAGIGWQPFLDIGAGTKPGPVSARETLCFALMQKAGQQSSSATTKGFQAQVCNTLFYLKDMADRLPDLPSDLLRRARPLLGKRFVSSDTFRTDVTDRVDGAAGFRSLAYREDCSCFQYVSPVKNAS